MLALLKFDRVLTELRIQIRADTCPLANGGIELAFATIPGLWKLLVQQNASPKSVVLFHQNLLQQTNINLSGDRVITLIMKGMGKVQKRNNTSDQIGFGALL